MQPKGEQSSGFQKRKGGSEGLRNSVSRDFVSKTTEMADMMERRWIFVVFKKLDEKNAKLID